MSILRRGIARLARRKAERRLAVLGCMDESLFRFAMKRVLLQKGIVFFLFQAVRRARTLLVPGRHIARRGFAQRLRFGAFECDDFLRHTITPWYSRPAS